MINRLNLKGNDLILFAMIYGFSQDGESEYRGSLKYMSDALRVSKNTVLSVKRRLIAENLILETKDKTGNRFRYNPEEVQKRMLVLTMSIPLDGEAKDAKRFLEESDKDVTWLVPGGANSEQGGGAKTEPSSGANSEPNKNTSKNKDIDRVPLSIRNRCFGPGNRKKRKVGEIVEIVGSDSYLNRRERFFDQVHKVHLEKEILSIEESRAFARHWVETDPLLQGTKWMVMKWEFEATFDIAGRMRTWRSNDQKWKERDGVKTKTENGDELR